MKGSSTEKVEAPPASASDKKIKGGPPPFTVTVALPGSVAMNPSREVRTFLCGQLARACAIWTVDEVVVYDDKAGEGERTKLSYVPCEFLARVLQYSEVPPYLRKALIPSHADLQLAGLLSPTHMPHHMQPHETPPFREGRVLEKPPGNRPGASGTGSFCEVGLKHDVLLDRVLKPGMRVTVKMDSYNKNGRSYLMGSACRPTKPRQEAGIFWGFQIRIASTLNSVFSECPYEEGYDCKIGTTTKVSAVSVDDKSLQKTLPAAKHYLVVLGPNEGLEEVVENDVDLKMNGSATAKLFNAYVRASPDNAGSRSLRVEEDLQMSMARLTPLFYKAHERKKKASEA
jgi:predicted SPOUT superfamily RNA methylase MTH1